MGGGRGDLFFLHVMLGLLSYFIYFNCGYFMLGMISALLGW